MIDETDSETVNTARELIEEDAENISFAKLAYQNTNGNAANKPEKENRNGSKFANGSVTIKLETSDNLNDKITNSDRTRMWSNFKFIFLMHYFSNTVSPS